MEEHPFWAISVWAAVGVPELDVVVVVTTTGTEVAVVVAVVLVLGGLAGIIVAPVGVCTSVVVVRWDDAA
jgi:hypothetical protein